MREIKFRAWESAQERMDYDPYGDEMLCEGTPINLCFRSPMEGQIFMQYIGLHDKRGVEIFEGDLIKTPTGIGEVRWDRCFCLFWVDKQPKFAGYTTLHDCKSENLEVTGNIYEDSILTEKAV